MRTAPTLRRGSPLPTPRGFRSGLQAAHRRVLKSSEARAKLIERQTAIRGNEARADRYAAGEASSVWCIRLVP
jgi:hypothetical protein